MKKLLLILLPLLLLSTLASGQVEKVLHQTFETKGIQEIALDLTGTEITVESWAGNLIMTETKIVLENASPSILEHFAKSGRYEVIGNRPEEGTYLTLVSKDKVRPALKSSRGEFKETVKVRVFMPEFYAASTENGPWTRRVELTDAPQEQSTPADTTRKN